MVHCVSDESIKIKAEAIGRTVLSAEAERVNRKGHWPNQTLQYLQQEGLAGLVIPQRYGGLGQGLLSLLEVTQALGYYSGSAGLCFGMHCVASAVLSDNPSPYQIDRYLSQIANGSHLTTLALSEPSTGAHFYLPSTALTYNVNTDSYFANGTKCFVTNAEHVDSYVISTIATEVKQNNRFTCAMVHNDNEGLTWSDHWQGFGMKGNHSKTLLLENTPIEKNDVLGAVGDHTHYIFHIVLPHFLAAMSGTYLGLVQRAIAEAQAHLKKRVYSHTADSLSNNTVLQHKLGELQGRYRSLYHLAHSGARSFDLSSGDAIEDVMLAKAQIAKVGANIVNECMTIVGGIGYVEPSPLTDVLRDIRAASVMSPTTDLLYLWVGRSRLGLSLLE